MMAEKKTIINEYRIGRRRRGLTGTTSLFPNINAILNSLMIDLRERKCVCVCVNLNTQDVMLFDLIYR